MGLKRATADPRLPEGAKIPRQGSRKRKVWDAYWTEGEEQARRVAQRLEIKDGSFRAWLSDWRMLARGELPAWMRHARDGHAKLADAAGFAEEPATFSGVEPLGGGTLRARIEMDRSGRIVIPAAIRAQMGIAESSKLVLLLEGEELRVFTHEAGVRRAQKMLAPYVQDRNGRSIVDELIEDRRREAAEEDLD